MTENNQPSDSLVFPVSERQKSIADMIFIIKGIGRWPAYHAIRHLNMAWKIKDIDKEMALFRAITAEEESATAVFRAIQCRGYNNSGKLKPRDHLQKNALSSFIITISYKLASTGVDIGRVSIFVHEDNRLGIKITRKTSKASSGSSYESATPIPPLEFKLSETFGESVARKIDFRSYFVE